VVETRRPGDEETGNGKAGNEEGRRRAALALGARSVGTIMRAAPSPEGMSTERVLKIQRRTVEPNRLANLLLGAPRKGTRTEVRSIPGSAGPIPIRVYGPSDSAAPLAAASGLPLIVYFHGGGFVTGGPAMGDWICSIVAQDLPAVVVSVGYRLAPTHRFPAAVDDCYDALTWLAGNATELGADPGRIGVLGESAGGNLAAVVCLLARDRGGPVIGHQALVYPLTDARLTTESWQRNPNAFILTAAAMRTHLDFCLGADGDPADWRISPLLAADHSSLPPALIQIAGHDPLYDDGELYASALLHAGVPVTLTDYPSMPHGFLNFPYFCRDATPAMAQIVQEQRRALATAA
jgi:acetyl esterase